jgi:fatty acyl-CoA reductase
VEKILRVQPDVKKIFLLVRASDVESAKLRIQMEVKYFILAFFFPPCFL